MWYGRDERDTASSNAEWWLIKWAFVLLMVGLAVGHFAWAIFADSEASAIHLVAQGSSCLLLLAGVYGVYRLVAWIVP